MESTPPIRVAVVGCGTQGVKHLDAYASEPDVEIAAVVDVAPERLAAAGTRFDVPPSGRLASYRDLDAVGRVDLVSVCTMPPTHRDVTVAALAAGANVLCEKPVALDARELDAMVAAAAAAGRFVTAGFNMRYMGAARYLRRLVADGTMGSPIAIRAVCMDVALPWWGPHYVRELSGGGVIAADAGHVLDLSLWVSGFPRPLTASAEARRLFPAKRGATAPSREAAARYDVEDAAGGFVRLDGPAWLSLELSWAADLPTPAYGFEAQFEHGSLRFDPLRVLVERDGEPVDVTDETHADTDWDASIKRGVQSVVAAVRGGTPPLVTTSEMLTVQRLIDALYASVELRREVALT
jgi:predicted dehydrogenase